MPPSVLPHVATISADVGVPTSFKTMVTNAASEVPGRIVADKKLLKNNANNDKCSIS